MKLVAVLATLLYVVVTLQVENKTALRSRPDNFFDPFISKKMMRVKRLREHGTPDKGDPVDALMLEQEGEKNKPHHVHTTDSSRAVTNPTEEPDVIGEPEDRKDLEINNSGSPICVRLQKECYEACEEKRDFCEEWRSLPEF